VWHAVKRSAPTDENVNATMSADHTTYVFAHHAACGSHLLPPHRARSVRMLL
jgi:hypothetical protein